MKISGRKSVPQPTPLDGLGAVSKPKPVEETGQSAEATGADNFELSETSKQIQSARGAIQGLPDVRLERVTEIKNALDDNSYHVQSEIIAKKMVNESLSESLRRR